MVAIHKMQVSGYWHFDSQKSYKQDKINSCLLMIQWGLMKWNDRSMQENNKKKKHYYL